MSLQVPRLDDRHFHDLLAEAKRLARERCPEWTDFSVGEPGTTLLELYAFLTEVMLYRVNRIPEKAYVEFLRLMGVQLAPPGAARVELLVRRSEGHQRRIEVPRGTRVSMAQPGQGASPPLFITTETLVLEPEQSSGTVVALQCEQIDAEFLGASTGLPGQHFQLRHAPVIAPTGDDLDLVVAVETESKADEDNVISHGDKAYRIWQKVEHFTGAGREEAVYVVDRTTGVITFAPSVRRTSEGERADLTEQNEALAATPPAGREILAWYRCGGGPEGNVPANTLTLFKDPMPGVRVNNPQAAVGGSAPESLENALIRGPEELHSLNRAVTARDYESVALREGSVARARAVAQAERWRYAKPGTVQLLLVPEVACGEGERCALAELEAAQTQQALTRVRASLDERRPLGTACVVRWYRYKPVRVRARLVIHPAEDARAVETRVRHRLYDLINPLGEHAFRRRLHASDVYHAALNEPGVLYAEQVQFAVDHAPAADVRSLASDPFHDDLWYAAAGNELYRSMDHGMGWDRLAVLPDEVIQAVNCCPFAPGLLAVYTRTEKRQGETTESVVRFSDDCGQTWRTDHALGFRVRDVAWLRRAGEPILLLATDEGLYQVPPESGPVPVKVDESDQDMGLYSVTVSDVPGLGVHVAVAARETKGVYLCPDEHLSEFQSIGLKGLDVRVLQAQRLGPRAFLWAGTAATGGNEGEGCRRWELRRGMDGGEGWTPMKRGWQGGSCLGLACDGARVYAATYHSGVVHIDGSQKNPEWTVPRIDAGLPLRDKERLLHRINAVATAPKPAVEASSMVLAAGPQGVYRSTDGGDTYAGVSAKNFPNQVTIGEGYVFCSDEHHIEAVHDATPSD
ncbi:putative baseplate assembly protein [Marinimicrobium locisalis]|uniref:putative baseplate assembly protein n=1 Tax=Marinimicrobium locisalis TaxID=546022 RepID=UPI00322162E5